MRVVRVEAQRRFSILTAEKSMRRKFIGACARIMGAVSVGRAMDSLKTAKGKIYLPDPVNDPTLIRGVDTQFDKEAQVGGLLALPPVNGNTTSAEILEIISPEEIRLKKEFTGADAVKQLTGKTNVNKEGQLIDGGGSGAKDLDQAFQGTAFKTAPKVDQTKVYNAVFDRLNMGGCVCIFPEGGSHDRTELLPLKGESQICLYYSPSTNRA